MSEGHDMSAEEQRLADLLKRVVPEPPRQLAFEEITVPHANRSRTSWLVPALAAAAVVVIGGTLSAVAVHLSGNSRTPAAPPAASQSSVAAASASATAVPTPTYSVTAVPTKKSGPVVVPNLVGMSVNHADYIARADGFAVELQEKAFPHLPPGTVGAQSPSAGTTVSIYVTIVLYYTPASVAPTPPVTAVPTATVTAVPTSAAPVPMPNVVGMGQTQAVQVLESAGFRVNVVDQSAPSNQPVPKGTVWEEWPTAGASAPHGALISIYVQAT
jgi:hypothetical protein